MEKIRPFSSPKKTVRITHMGSPQLLTKEQKTVLDEVRQNKFLQKNFYFTGGTALSSLYLRHRYSDDLDFFSSQKFDTQTIFAIMQEWSQKHKFTFQSRLTDVMYTFDLSFGKELSVKIDFAYYPCRRLETGQSVDGVEVDSLIDIAVNKLVVVSQRSNVKDFVDLYYLLDKFSVWDLMEGVRVKFNIKTEPFLLAVDFLKVEDFDFLPRMIKPLTLEELKGFFAQKAKEIGFKTLE